MITEADIQLAGGRTLHAYDTSADDFAGQAGSPPGASRVAAVATFRSMRRC
jgi:hypothetical protein